MAAHLHRYKSELHRVEGILSEVQSSKFDTLDVSDDNVSKTNQKYQDGVSIEHLTSQLTAIVSFSNELESKIQNILTLVRPLNSFFQTQNWF